MATSLVLHTASASCVGNERLKTARSGRCGGLGVNDRIGEASPLEHIGRMKPRLLDVAEFEATIVEPMRDVTETATDVIDIWPYVAAVPRGDLAAHEIMSGVVERVYRNGDGTFDHVLVMTKSKDVYLAVIVDLARQTIFGHHLLDLKYEYGRTVRH